MNNQALFLFLILLAGLIFCSCLGVKEGFDISTYTGVNSGQATKDSSELLGGQGNVYGSDVQSHGHHHHDYDNYNHFDKSSYPTTYYGPNGETAKLINSNGNYSIIVTNANGNTFTYNVNSNTTSTTSTDNGTKSSTYYGPKGGKASIVTNNGTTAVQVTDSNGNSTLYVSQNPQIYNQSSNASSNASINANVNTTGTSYNAAYSSGPYGGSVNSVQSAYGGSTSASDPNSWQSALPAGIPGSQIPPGHEDLYILKSQVVPPVCPVCPACQGNSNSSSSGSLSGSSSGSGSSSPWGSSDSSKCPPCPACARCPEPSFECKKVPNYNAINNDYLPQPVLNSFSNFGM
jgi:hypothetical protein